MKLERRQFIRLAASGAVLPALSLRRALAQPLPNPSGVPAPSASERAAMARLAHTFMEKYDVPALSLAVGYAGEIVHRDAFGGWSNDSRDPMFSHPGMDTPIPISATACSAA